MTLFKAGFLTFAVSAFVFTNVHLVEAHGGHCNSKWGFKNHSRNYKTWHRHNGRRHCKRIPFMGAGLRQKRLKCIRLNSFCEEFMPLQYTRCMKGHGCYWFTTR